MDDIYYCVKSYHRIPPAHSGHHRFRNPSLLVLGLRVASPSRPKSLVTCSHANTNPGATPDFLCRPTNHYDFGMCYKLVRMPLIFRDFPPGPQESIDLGKHVSKGGRGGDVNPEILPNWQAISS
ncbi:hypothetical protein HOLleu_28880 [Holothuria leucospilota]|uniref:Uncharacterized protein n=1 Tax=Holothuria leucospilota TaxID=206669 RepID=A0A9Q1BN22_HOLLE|nr:hypothetical protein HOLleu_28880 [Holothuria leucospilota]